jgi:hypothetical protein
LRSQAFAPSASTAMVKVLVARFGGNARAFAHQTLPHTARSRTPANTSREIAAG